MASIVANHNARRFMRAAKNKLPAPWRNWLINAAYRGLNIYHMIKFLVDPSVRLSLSKRLPFLVRIARINAGVECGHINKEILAFCRRIFELGDREGVFVEAGCYKGGSAAKFSIACSMVGRRLYVFDSFAGLPDTNEQHTTTIFGGPTGFHRGEYKGTRTEVEANVRHYGEIGCCTFIEGWFKDTMPEFREPVLAAYLDVDLVSSTRTCLKHLYPLIVPGGALLSQDGHLPLVLELLDDNEFWRKELQSEKPRIMGFGVSKVIEIRK
jgi:O-methyltransferase